METKMNFNFGGIKPTLTKVDLKYINFRGDTLGAT
jgi:hypothetical protein